MAESFNHGRTQGTRRRLVRGEVAGWKCANRLRPNCERVLPRAAGLLSFGLTRFVSSGLADWSRSEARSMVIHSRVLSWRSVTAPTNCRSGETYEKRSAKKRA